MLRAHSSQILWGLATKGATFVLFYALQILLVRRLGLRDYGLWSVFYSVFSVGMIFSCLGLNHSARKYAAEHDGTTLAADVLRSALKLRYAASAIAAALWLALAFLAARFLQPELASLFIWSAPLLFLCAFGELFKELFIGLRRIDYNCVQSSVEHGLKIVFCAIVFFYVVSLKGALSAFTVALALTALSGWLLLRPYLSGGQGRDFRRPLYLYALPLLASELLAVLMCEFDTIALGLLRPPEEVGLYSVAKQVIFKAPHLALALGMGVLPVFAKAEKPLQEQRLLFGRLLKLNFWLAGAAAVLLTFLGAPVLGLLFGEQSRAAAGFFPWLAPYLLASTYNVYFSYLLEYRGQARLIAWHLGIALLLGAALLALLIPTMGAKGAALAMSCGYVALAVLNGRAAFKLLG